MNTSTHDLAGQMLPRERIELAIFNFKTDNAFLLSKSFIADLEAMLTSHDGMAEALQKHHGHFRAMGSLNEDVVCVDCGRHVQ